MPRVGKHPMKTSAYIPLPKQRQLTMTTIVHIPELTGFWAESLEVLTLCFQSLFAHTSQPFDLMVFDNGSCKEVQEYLMNMQQKGFIQYLIFSHYNQRKTRAMGFLFREAPGEIIGFTDPDVYFLPGWLDASLKVLSAFPRAGMITAMPFAVNAGSYYYEPTFHAASQDPTISITIGDDLIPEEYILAHSISVGVPIERYKRDRISHRQDVKISKGGVNAYAVAVDFQFLTARSVLQEILPTWDEHAKALSEKEEEYLKGDQISIPVLEYDLDQKGFWKLSTAEYLVHHMGNRVPNLHQELPWVEVDALNMQPQKKVAVSDNSKLISALFRSTRVRNLAKKIHLTTYRWLYE